MKKLTQTARILRKNMTEQEYKLWSLIKNKQFDGCKFLRQYVIGNYIVDFVCREKKVIIEIDGAQHNINKNIIHDEERTKFLEKLGYSIIRFWNNDIDYNIEGVYQKLQEVLNINNQHPPLPLPRKGGDDNMNIIGLKDKNLYYIGGVVRDEILGTKNYDVDLTYDGDAVEFAKTIDGAEILQINEPFGTVKIKYNNQEIDIASTRSEDYPQKGHLPVVKKIGCSLKEDVMRRDFTINAMAKSTLTGEISDYTGGLSDIKNKKIRVLHDESFIDDPTRILRALKFSVRFGFELEEHTQHLQKKYLENINYDMSYKRLQKELKETFDLNSWTAFEKFVNEKIYKLISQEEFELPKYDFSKLISKYEPDNMWIIYIGLLPDISSLPLSKNENKIVESFKVLKNTSLESDFDIYKTFKNIPIESVIMYSSINPDIVEQYFENLHDIKLQITGKDLKNLGVEPSEKYQEFFDFVIRKKIENKSLKLSDEISLAKEFFKL